MPYVGRDEHGQIAEISLVATARCSEWQEPDDPAVANFLGQARGEPKEAMARLVDTDQALIRVVEDLVNALISKDILHFTDLPEAAQQKLLQRQSLRKSINALNLLGDDEQKLL